MWQNNKNIHQCPPSAMWGGYDECCVWHVDALRGHEDCVNVCLCQVRICQKVYVIAGITLLKLALGGLCLFASVKSFVLTLICPLLIPQIRLMRGSLSGGILIGSGWILYDIQIIAALNGNTKPLSPERSLSPISLVVSLPPTTSAVRSHSQKKGFRRHASM